MSKSPGYRTRFRRRATFFICISILVITSGGFVLRYSLGYGLLIHNSRIEQKRLAFNAASLVSRSINEEIKDLNAIFSSLRIGEKISETNHFSEQDKHSLTRFVDVSEDIAGLIFVDKNCGILSRVGGGSFDAASCRGMAQAAFNYGRGRIVVGEADFNRQDDTAGIYLFVPVRDAAGGIAAIAVAVVPARKIFDILGGFRFGRSGHVVLIDENGRILYHPDRQDLIGVNLLDGDRLDLLKHKGRLDVGLLSYGTNVMINYADVNHYAVYREGRTWKILTIIKSGEVFEPLSELTRQGMVVSAFLILILVVVGFMFSGFFTKPIRKLRDATQKISAGDLDYKIDINTGDEIQELAESFMSMARNIKYQRRRLIEEKAYLETMVNNMYGGVFMTDDFGQLIVLNEQARIFLGLGLGKIDSDAFAGRMENLGLDECFEACRNSGRVVTKEISFHASPDRTIRCEITPVKNESGGVIGFVTGIRDVTQQKEIDRMKNSFVSVVSHELRTPLAIIKEAISLVLDRIPGPINSSQDDILHRSKTNIERLERIVDNLLDISKIEAGKIDLRRSLCDIVSLARESGLSFEALAGTRNISLRFDLPPKELTVYLDKDKITQVFTNLLGNSIKFTKEGHVDISVVDKGDYVECAVTDSGIGIAKDDLPKVFDKFQQFGRAAGEGEKGTGLGLAIAKGIVELHKGTIWVESNLGEGTKFAFTLPKYSGEALTKEVIISCLRLARDTERNMIVFVFKLEEEVPDLDSLLPEMIKRFNLDTENKREFTVTLSGPDKLVVAKIDKKIDAYGLINRLGKDLKQFFFEKIEQRMVDFSYGFSVFPDDAREADDLLGLAQANLTNYKAQQFKKSILIVDDETALCRSVRKMLSAWGYDSVDCAQSGPEAFEKIGRHKFDLIILDLKMPGMNGYEVIGRLKEDIATQDIPVLIMSGYEMEIVKIEQYLKRKAIVTVSKPLDLNQLEKFVYYLI